MLSPVPRHQAGCLPVNEIFYSIQGEGRWIGTPAVFIRLQYCNLGCSWCDTPSTWDKSVKSDDELFTVETVAGRARRLVPDDVMAKAPPHVVITGGEPMLHSGNLPPLIRSLKRAGFTFFEIETNATIEPSRELLNLVSWWNCSPKLSNNRRPEEYRLNVKALNVITGSGRADFKFVICTPDDLEEIEQTYSRYLPSASIWLMPEGMLREDQLRSLAEVVTMCLEKGYRLSPRLHTLIWNNERGR